jgi:hypothetical protein
VFPDGEVVVDNPFLIYPNVRFSQRRSLAQQENSGDEGADFPEKPHSLMVRRILQGRAF